MSFVALREFYARNLPFDIGLKPDAVDRAVENHRRHPLERRCAINLHCSYNVAIHGEDHGDRYQQFVLAANRPFSDEAEALLQPEHARRRRNGSADLGTVAAIEALPYATGDPIKPLKIGVRAEIVALAKEGAAAGPVG